MAEKRMFSTRITGSDAFLDMPLSSRCLYFHLGMEADDDGFLNNAKTIQRMIGASEDDLKLLISKSFVIMFGSGVMVIKHWNINNYIRSDRKKSTNYTEELACLELKKNGAYTLIDSSLHLGIPNDNQMSGTCQHRLDKIRLDKNSITYEQIPARAIIDTFPAAIPKVVSATINDFEELWKLYPKKLGKDKALKKYKEYLKKDSDLFDKVKAGIEKYIEYIKNNNIESQYIKYGSTFFNNKGWEDEYTTIKTKGKKEKEKPDWYDNYNKELEEHKKAQTKPKELTKEEIDKINEEAKELFK